MSLATKSVLATAPAAAVLVAADAKRAWSFYHDQLGLETEWVPDLPDNFLAHAGDGSAFLVYQSTLPRPDSTVMSFQVGDLDGAMSDLRAHGVTFEEYDMPGLTTVNGVATLGSAKSAWFRDSEGNIISLAQM